MKVTISNSKVSKTLTSKLWLDKFWQYKVVYILILLETLIADSYFPLILKWLPVCEMSTSS